MLKYDRDQLIDITSQEFIFPHLDIIKSPSVKVGYQLSLLQLTPYFIYLYSNISCWELDDLILSPASNLPKYHL